MKVVTFETTDGKVRYLLVDAGGVPIEEVRQFLKFEDNRGMARNAKDPLTDKTPITTGKNSIDAAATKAAVENAKNTAIKAIQDAQGNNGVNPPHSHSFFYVGVIVEPTTENSGVGQYRCSECNECYYVTVPKLTATVTPEPTSTTKPTDSPEPTATVTPEPTDAPKPTSTPKPTDAPEPTSTPEPTAAPAKYSKDFEVLRLSANAAGETAMELTWTGIDGAVTYKISGNKCDKADKKYDMELLATFGADTSSCTITGLEKATYYKFNIEAYAEDGTLLKKSVLVRAVTDGGKYTNAAKLVLTTKKKLTLGIGDTEKVKAELEFDDRNLKYYTNKAFGKIFRLESSNRKVAKVKNGKIIAVGKGTCDIYVYAQNGEYRVIKVTVK